MRTIKTLTPVEGQALLHDSSEEDATGEEELESSQSTASLEPDFLDFEDVLREESEALKYSCHLRRADVEQAVDAGSGHFSLAFSGGGIRAAAFQLGVMWRLGEAGLLDNVEHISAVSGGSWAAAAYVSHVVEAGCPLPGQSPREWRLQIVARTVTRMLSNMPYLARDLGKDPCGCPRDGAGCLPRAFDIPILFGSFVWSLSVRLLMFLSLYVIPFVEFVEILFGGNMRKYYCSHDEVEASEGGLVGTRSRSHNMLLQLCSIPLQVFCWAIGAAIVLRILKLLKPFKKPGSSASLWLQGVFATAARLAALMAILVLMVGTTTFLEKWAADYALRNDREACAAYQAFVDNQTLHPSCIGTPWGSLFSWETRGANYGEEYYNVVDDPNLVAKNSTTANINCMFPKDFNGTIGHLWNECVTEGAESVVHSLSDSLIPATWTLLMITILVTLIFIPFFPSTIATIVMLALPIMMLAIAGSMVQWRVFGNLRRMELLSLSNLYYSSSQWARIYQCSLIATMLVLPFYNFFRGNSHKFYRRSLRRAFFAGGKEVRWGKIKENQHCPLLILNATAMDYICPGDKLPINRLSVTPLHTGGKKLGFIRTRPAGRVSKAMALSGAAHDAVILGKADHMKVRFWLEMLGIGVGENMHFRPQVGEPSQVIQWASSWARRVLRIAGQAHDPDDIPSLLIALPSLLLWELVYGLLFLAEVLSSRRCWCQLAEVLFLMALILLCGTLILSFFAFVPCLDWVLHSPVVRTIHQVTGFYHRAARPPGLLYVTDGMIEDNTGVMDLLHRQCRHILLIYAGAQKGDDKDNFNFLQKIAEAAAAAKIASIFDMEDSRRHWRASVGRFERDQERTCLQLGILYGWDGDSQTTGRLLVLRLHLPPSLKSMPCQPLITEDEIMGEDASEDTDAEEHLPTEARQLLGCCCDCCHRHRLRGCPRTFPYPPTGMQFLSPQVTSSLVRLGHAVAREAVTELRAPLQDPSRPRHGAL